MERVPLPQEAVPALGDVWLRSEDLLISLPAETTSGSVCLLALPLPLPLSLKAEKIEVCHILMPLSLLSHTALLPPFSLLGPVCALLRVSSSQQPCSSAQPAVRNATAEIILSPGPFVGGLTSLCLAAAKQGRCPPQAPFSPPSVFQYLAHLLALFSYIL